MSHTPAQVLHELDLYLTETESLYLLELLDDPIWQTAITDVSSSEGAKDVILIGKLNALDILAGLIRNGNKTAQVCYYLREPSSNKVSAKITADQLEDGVLASPYKYIFGTSNTEKRHVMHLIKYYFMKAGKFEGNYGGAIREFNSRFRGMLLDMEEKEEKDVAKRLERSESARAQLASGLEDQEAAVSQSQNQGPSSKSRTESTTSYDPAHDENSDYSLLCVHRRNNGLLPLWEQLPDRDDMVFTQFEGLPDGAHPVAIHVGMHRPTENPMYAYLHKPRTVYDVKFFIEKQDTSSVEEIDFKEVCMQLLESPFDWTFEDASKIRKHEQIHFKTILKWYYMAAGVINEGFLEESPRDYPLRLRNALQYIEKVRVARWNQQQMSLVEEVSGLIASREDQVLDGVPEPPEVDANLEVPELDPNREIPESPLENDFPPTENPPTVDPAVASKPVQQATPESLPAEAEVSEVTTAKLMEMLEADSRLEKGLGDLDTKIAGLKRKRDGIEMEIEEAEEERRTMEGARKKAREAFRRESTNFS